MTGITTLDSFTTSKITAVIPGKKARLLTCPACAEHTKAEKQGQYFSRASLPLMEELRYARDYIIRGCRRCGRTYYYDSSNKRFIELSFSFRDFDFGGDER